LNNELKTNPGRYICLIFNLSIRFTNDVFIKGNIMDSYILNEVNNDLHCQFCNGTLNKLGILGNLEYFKYQKCDMEFSVNLSRIKINKADNTVKLRTEY